MSVLIILTVLGVIALLTIFLEREVPTVQLGKGWDEREKVRIRYGEDERQFVDLYLPDRREVWLAFVVHGGGFRGGTATGSSAKTMANPFFEKGFAVASVEYRVCPSVKWPTPLEDIAQGIRATLSYLESEGVEVRGSVYIGSSAGAIAGALLIYGPEADSYGVWNIFNGYIGLSGGYCISEFPEARLRESNGTYQLCAIEIWEIFPFDEFTDVRRVPALLIAGDEDRLLDGRAGTNGVNHQARCFASLLRSRGVHVRTLYLRGGHSAPVRRIAAGGDGVLSTINEFLSNLMGG
ncbi:MAG: alpha/beta hydrolase [Candidatus Korarchaeota archaeon]|nr:alpha/beta hydrolase [Candidatus Korarchaeota archaeon]